MEERLQRFLQRFLRRASSGPRAALFLTFQFDGPEFVRRLWEPILLRRGFSRRNSAVLLDAGFPWHVEPAAQDLRVSPRLCRVSVPGGCFHPKLAVVVVGKEWFLSVGSANLSRGGLGGNLELAQSFDSFESTGSIAADARVFLEDLKDYVTLAQNNNPWKDGQIARVAGVLPRTRQGNGARLLSSIRAPLLEQMAKAIGTRKVRAATVISPLHLPGQAYENETAGGRKEVSGIIKDFCRLGVRPASLRLYSDFRGAVAYRPKGGEAIQIFSRHVSEVSDDGVDRRPLHAKAYQFRADGAWHVFWGSANFTGSALAKPAHKGGNVELLVYERVRGRLMPINPRGFRLVSEFGPAPEKPNDFVTGPVMMSAEFSAAKGRLTMEWAGEYRGGVDVRAKGTTYVRIRLAGEGKTIIDSRAALARLGLAQPLLYYRAGRGPWRWIEILTADDGAETPVENARPLEEDILEILGALRKSGQSEACGDGGDGQVHLIEDEDDSGIGFTEHDGAMLLFFRRWRNIFRRMALLKKNSPDVYDVYIGDVVERVSRQANLGLGELAFLLDCLSREELAPSSETCLDQMRRVCERLDGEPRLAVLSRIWRSRIQRK